MKKRFFILTLILAIIVCFNPIIARADGIVVSSSDTIYIDTGEDITTGTNYNNNFISCTSDCDAVATGSFSNGTLTITGNKSGTANITLRLGTASDYTDYYYKVEVTSVFSNVTYSYNYNKITVNYDKDALPNGCKPVFSIDGENWQESNTLTRNKDNDGVIYKAFKAKNGVITGSLKKLYFDQKATETSSYHEHDLTLYVGASYDVGANLNSSEEYYYCLMSGPTDISFNESKMLIEVNTTGKAKLDVFTYNKQDYAADGSINTTHTQTRYNITAKNPSDTNYNYIINTNTNKIHLPSCSSVANMSEDNKRQSTLTLEELKNLGYEPCKLCINTSNSNSNVTPGNNNTNNGGNQSNNNTNSSNNSSSNSGSSNGSSSSNNSNKSNVTGVWKSNGTGWWYEYSDGTYPTSKWVNIDNNWYYFNASGYMESNCYRDGYWLNADGSWNTAYYGGTWKSNGKGWWYEDNGWYPTSQWLYIDGAWYYFKADGYMATNEYIDGYWINSNGVCN